MRSIMSLNEVLDETYDIYRKNMKSFIGYTALMLMITTTIMYGVMLVAGLIFVLIGIVAASAAGALGSLEMGGGWMMIVGIYAAVILLMVPASAVIQMVAAGPIQAIQAFQKGERVTFGAMFSFSFKHMLRIISSTLALYILFAAIILIGGLFYAGVYFTLLPFATVAAKVVIGILVALIILGVCIWLGVNSAFYLEVAICENKHFMKAVMGSFALVRGRFRHVFWILFTYGLSFMVVYMSLGGLASLAGNLMAAFMSDNSSTGFIILFLLLQILSFAIQMAVSIFLTPLQYLTIPMAYFNERNRKYGDDLQWEADRLLEIAMPSEQEVVL